MRRKARRNTVAGLVVALAVSTLAACGSSSGTPTLTWYINPDNGSQATLAAECTAAAHGAYQIKTSILPTDATEQRQQLVTRLAAKDSSIDLMSLDPVYVAEFAEAGFLETIPASEAAQFTTNIVKPAVEASTWKGNLVAAPFWANTQLLWYRKSVAQAAGLDMTKPVTWLQVIDAAKSQNKTVGVQADLYEGYTVWINALIAGAGGEIVENPGASASDLKLGISTQAGVDAATVIQDVVRAGVGGPALSTNEEAQSLALFEAASTSGFLVNWPYTWAQMEADKVSFRNTDVGWAPYPETVAGQASHPPFGGIEIGIGAYGKHKDLALDATKCITSEQHQTEYMINSGNPSANTQSYSDPKVKSLFPMASLILSSLQAAAPRPQSQYYGDLSGALQQSFSPPDTVTPTKTPEKAQSFVKDVIEGKRLL